MVIALVSSNLIIQSSDIWDLRHPIIARGDGNIYVNYSELFTFQISALLVRYKTGMSNILNPDVFDLILHSIYVDWLKWDISTANVLFKDFPFQAVALVKRRKKRLPH